MNKKTAVKLSLLAPMLCAALALSASAQAQSGKRICGQWGALPNNGGYVGILVEVQNDASATANAACDHAKSISKTKVLAIMGWSDAKAASVTWTVQGTTACENLGKNFASTKKPNVDMCQYMEGYSIYYINTSKKDPASSNFSDTEYYLLPSAYM